MPKVEYLGIKFDSELEVEYYKHLEKEKEQGKITYFLYHPKQPIKVTSNNSYTPDFVVYYADTFGFLERCEIVETKGYSQFSFMKDNMIHNIMNSKTETELKEWLALNNLIYKCKVVYKKIKYLKAYGFVDWDFKNPNTLANKRKEKINDLSAELKELKEFKKNALRFFNYWSKPNKLTKKQKEWFDKYVLEIKETISNNE